MTREERRSKLESFGHAPILLAGVLRQFPKKMWLYKPSPERWSIHETILHLADSEASGYVRCRRFIAEPDKMLAEKDPVALALFAKYKQVNMPNLRLRSGEIAAILNYLKTQSAAANRGSATIGP